MRTLLSWRGVPPTLIDPVDGTCATVEIREEPEHKGSSVWLMFDKPEDLLFLADQLAALYERVGKPPVVQAEPFLPKPKVAGYISSSKY